MLGACIGAALGGLRPIGEMQFNDFVATGFNQLVNNAAKTHYRWGAPVPMVIRMPWGGLRSAGPYHSQNTEAWFYRTPGLKIVAPSTPIDARALLAAAVADPDPVLFYEHIGLYRDPSIKQHLDEEAPEPLQLGQAALRRSGSDLAIVSYGAYVHVARRTARDASGRRLERCGARPPQPRTAGPVGAARRGAPLWEGAHHSRGHADREASARASPPSFRRTRSSIWTPLSRSARPSTPRFPTRRRWSRLSSRARQTSRRLLESSSATSTSDNSRLSRTGRLRAILTA